MHLDQNYVIKKVSSNDGAGKAVSMMIMAEG
jgi:hypothetical protein